jgi:hypothetical protein
MRKRLRSKEGGQRKFSLYTPYSINEKWRAYEAEEKIPEVYREKVD